MNSRGLTVWFFGMFLFNMLSALRVSDIPQEFFAFICLLVSAGFAHKDQTETKSSTDKKNGIQTKSAT